MQLVVALKTSSRAAPLDTSALIQKTARLLTDQEKREQSSARYASQRISLELKENPFQH